MIHNDVIMKGVPLPILALLYLDIVPVATPASTRKVIYYQLEHGQNFAVVSTECSSHHRSKDAFSRNVGKVFIALKLVTDNLLL